MGFGKIVQVILFLVVVLYKKGICEDIENNMLEFLLRSMKKEFFFFIVKKMFLIVVFFFVFYNWKDELDIWGYFRVIVLYGNRKDNELICVKQRKCEIVLIIYEILCLCLDEFNSLEWLVVIVDEVYRIKNLKVRIIEVMKVLKCSVCIGFIGIIFQNNMKELWCVMDWVVLGFLGIRICFKKQFFDLVEYGQRYMVIKRELVIG